MRAAQFTALLLFGTLPALGCLGQYGEADAREGTLGGLRLEGVVEEHGSLFWSLVNESNDHVSLGGDGSLPVLRIEALQADGTWEQRVARSVSPVLGGGAEVRDVWPGETSAVGGLYGLEAGTYRVLARVDGPAGPVDAVREVAVVGWPEAMIAEAQRLSESAEAARCELVARSISHELFAYIEADLLVDLFEDLPADEEIGVSVDDRYVAEMKRETLLSAMIKRGSFTAELSFAVERMSTNEALSFANYVLAIDRSERHQVPLRRAIAARLLRDLRDLGDTALPLDPGVIYFFRGFKEQWPADVPHILTRRLGSGHDSRDAVAGLIRALGDAAPRLSDGERANVLRVIQERCDGASGRDMVESCERGIAKLSPGDERDEGEESDLIEPFGPFYGCGTVWQDHFDRCGGQLREWREIVDAVGPPQPVFLGASVEAAE